ncbi:MAG: indole-3-glycerol phosphate synthase/phosphoribosylanthranilate isomerase [Alphaproteobacteria bacterium]
MANVLEQIVADKRDELKIKKELLPLAHFKDKLKPSSNSFFDALAAKGTSYIFECKKASPSKGLIRENFDLDEITDAYQKEAACFSVLTDEKYFQGKFEYLQFVSEKVAQPTINKDFFVDEYQVYLGRHLGANAVLLMLSVLSDEEYTKLAAITHELKMDVLTEVSNSEETERALCLGANIIGINNRNLRDLSTELATTERLAPLIKNDPRFKGVIISESGIYTFEDIQRLSALVDGFLVGSALMARADLDLAVSQLVYGKVKVCGITSIEQANLVASYPVSYLGFIFAPNSKRYVSIETALEITHQVNQQFVGVFVNQPMEQVIEFSHKLSLSAIQLHGQESLEYAVELKKLLPSRCEIWKAMPIDMHNANSIESELAQLQSHLTTGVLSRVLLDCKVGEQTGGTGQAFDWRLLDDISDKSTLVLAGGVSSQNIQAASKTGVGIIDVNSGVEDAPGNKTKAKLKELFALLRA